MSVQGYVGLASKDKQNVKISNSEASNKGLRHACACTNAASVQRKQPKSSGIWNVEEWVPSGLRGTDRRFHTFLPARMKDSKSKLSKRGTRVYDLLRPASMQVPRSSCGAVCTLKTLQKQTAKQKTCFFTTFSTCGVTAVET